MARIKWRTQASDKKLRKARTVSYSSKNRFPKTRATAQRNRSKARTWLLKDRGNARRSHAESGGKARKTQGPETKQTLLIPLTNATLPNDALSKPCAQQIFQKSNKSPPCSITSPKISPLSDHFSQKFSPLLAHAHIKPKKMPKPPPEIMLCNECRAEGVSEPFRHTKDMII